MDMFWRREIHKLIAVYPLGIAKTLSKQAYLNLGEVALNFTTVAGK